MEPPRPQSVRMGNIGNLDAKYSGPLLCFAVAPHFLVTLLFLRRPVHVPSHSPCSYA
ncbi:hypothetical protein BDV11DRAFT_197403 [Aspergillus similis]